MRKLEKNQWFGFFEDVSKRLPNAKVDVEVLGDDVGDQHSVQWTSWRGVTYDYKDDVLEVFTEALTHRIAHPAEIWVDETAPGLESIQVRDGDGNRQIIGLRAPLRLAAEAQGAEGGTR